MDLDALFKGVILAECGLCCSKSSLCENCEKATLRANGLSIHLDVEIRGLAKTARGHSGFQYSDLYHKIQKLQTEYLK